MGSLFALRVKDDLQHAAALVYAGGALGVTFAGDLVSLYVFWELMAISFHFPHSGTPDRSLPGCRLSAMFWSTSSAGCCLLAGIVIYIQQSGTLEFGYIGLGGPASWLIFVGIALNAAIPPLHPWLQDAYPEATVTGAVFLSALTTKSAVYAHGPDLSRAPSC